MKWWLLLLAIVPVAAATAIAGVVSNPSAARPCFEEFTEGFDGRPTHLILGPGGMLFATEEVEKKILRFNPETHKAKEFKVPVEPHDLTAGPDGRVWFVSATGKPTKPVPRRPQRQDRQGDDVQGDREGLRAAHAAVEPRQALHHAAARPASSRSSTRTRRR